MEQIVTNNNSLSIVTCPVCHRAITVYMDTGPETEMACPLCRSTYSFQAVLDGLPPMILLASELELSPSPKTEEEPKKFSFDEVPAPPAPKRSSRSKRRSSSSSSGGSSTHLSSEARRQRSEKKRKAAFKKSSPFRETILFVLGGLMALPVGQLIIWWVIGKDPLNFGPPVSRVAAFVVPEKFRGTDDGEEVGDENSKKDENGSGQAKSDTNGDGKIDGKLKLTKPDTDPKDIIKDLDDQKKGKKSGGKPF